MSGCLQAAATTHHSPAFFMTVKTNTAKHSLCFQQLVGELKDSVVGLSRGKGRAVNWLRDSAGVLSVEPWG